LSEAELYKDPGILIVGEADLHAYPDRFSSQFSIYKRPNTERHISAG
jgi:hypothetical protein